MTPEQLRPLVQTALTELLRPRVLPGQEPITMDSLTAAGRLVSQRYDEHHRLSHANAQRGGAVIWAMRERGLSWREIYDATGIVQRTAARWVNLFVAEGITEYPDAELRRRADGEPDA